MNSIDWNKAYGQVLPSVKWMCNKILGYNHNFLDDAISDTFEKAIMKENQFDPSKASLKTWMCSIARNVCLQILKKDKDKLPLIFDIADESEEEPLDERLNKKMMLIIESFDDSINKRAFFDIVNGLSYEDIAKTEKCLAVSIRGRVKRFMDSVRLKVKDDPDFAQFKKSGKNFTGIIKSKKPENEIVKQEKNIYLRGNKFYVYGTCKVTGKSKYLGSFYNLEEAKEAKQNNKNK